MFFCVIIPMEKFRILAYMLLLAVVGLLTSCNDDDTFTTSKSNLLAFSTDTVRLDTTFSKVPTPTKTFWVYNRSGNGIRLANVRLEQGNQTGFRVNVDGIYLGQANGYQVNGLEVRNKDSIRVFVELTTPKNGKTDPQLVEDNLVFTLESTVQQKVNLKAYSWDAELLKNIEIKHDTTIQSTKPIVVQGGIKVNEGATLTIGAGTTLYFSNKAGIDVHGQLKIAGTADKIVTLRGDRLDHIFDYLPYDRVSGQWQGIHFNTSSYDNEIEFADIHSTYNGIVCDSSSVDRSTLSLRRSTIHNCQGYGLLATNCKIDVSNSQITNTLKDCAAFFGGNITLSHCTLAQFYPFDGNRGAALRFGNSTDGKQYTLQQFNVFNTLITGYAEDVIMGAFSDEAAQNFKFDHSILRTIKPKEIDAAKYVEVLWEEAADTVQSGEKHFRKIDGDKQAYDFHLSEKSKARDIGVALPNGISTTDHDGFARDEKPDVGCYEYRPEKKKD